MPGGEKEKRPGLSRGPEVPRECLVWLGCMVEGGRSRDELQRWVGTIAGVPVLLVCRRESTADGGSTREPTIDWGST